MKRLKMRKIVSVGDVGIDDYINLGIKKLGGIAFNFAFNVLEVSGGDVEMSMVAPLGKNDVGYWIRKKIGQLGINVDSLRLTDGKTPKQDIYLEDGGERKFVGYDAGVLKNWSLIKPELEFIKKHDVVFIPLSDGMEKVFNVVMEISDIFKVVDFSQDYEYADLDKERNIVTKYGPMFDLVFVGGKPSEVNLMRKMSEQYPNKIFVLTLGSRGSLAFCNKLEYEQPAIKVKKLVDTTGCGDAFQAGFLTEYLRSKDIHKSLFQGSKQAMVVIEKVGSTEIDIIV